MKLNALTRARLPDKGRRKRTQVRAAVA